MANETKTQKADQKKQVSAQISLEDFDKLEGYAYGTRRKISEVLKEAVSEYLVNHKTDIENKSV